MSDGPDPRAVTAVEYLHSRGWTLATAESLTAGLLAATVAEVPGASGVLRGGLVVYASELKTTLAGVPEDMLARHGAVSAETACSLADGAARRCGADVGIGLTGVAGPDRQEGHPVGTVHLGIRIPGAAPWAVALSLAGDRSAIRSGACFAALDLLVGIGAGPRGNVSGT